MLKGKCQRVWLVKSIPSLGREPSLLKPAQGFLLIMSEVGEVLLPFQEYNSVGFSVQRSKPVESVNVRGLRLRLTVSEISLHSCLAPRARAGHHGCKGTAENSCSPQVNRKDRARGSGLESCTSMTHLLLLALTPRAWENS